MTRNDLEQLQSIDAMCDAAAAVSILVDEGSIEQRFISGWTNAMDMIDSGDMAKDDFESFRLVALSDVRNYF